MDVRDLAGPQRGLLPSGYSALIEQYAGGVDPDVLTVERRPRPRPSGQAAVAAPPATRWSIEARTDPFVRRANRVAIRHRLGEVVCVIEVVSPGNKAGRASTRQFVGKTLEFLRAGVNVLLVDPLPTTPAGAPTLHDLIWAEIDEAAAPFNPPADEP